MSRLYIKADTDMRRTQLTGRGSQSIHVELLWGSRSDSKLACSLDVNWLTAEEKPKITLQVAKGLEAKAKYVDR